MGKLNEMLKAWPSGTVAVQPWLAGRHIVRQLSNKYVTGGWVERIGSGAYIRAGDRVAWQGGVYALQQQLDLPVHVGGITALELLGRSHFIQFGNNRSLYLYTHGKFPDRRLPKWLIQHFNTTTFTYVPTELFSNQLGLESLDCGTFNITGSSSERALLEVLALVAKKLSFEHAYLLMEGQDTLRVELLQALLYDCRSYLLKRLFLYLAKKCQLPWLERLNLTTIALGAGKRKIGNGEHYDPELKLLVPLLNIDRQQDLI